jgi:beta-lactamase class D
MRFCSIFGGAALLALGMGGASAAGLSPHFQGRFGTIEIFDSQAKLSFRVNTPRLAEALPACGTGYLVLAAAAFKQGTLRPDATTREYDPIRYPATPDWPSSWQRPQTLESALRYGTPWYFSELQAGLGPQLAGHVGRFGLKLVGNNHEGWRISTLDQVEWLKKLRSNAIGLSPQAHSTLLSALVRDTQGDETLYGVGGRCAQDADYWLAWQVGWVERSQAKAPAFYALNAEGKSRADLSGVSRRIARDTLTEMKLWKKPEPLPAPAIPIESMAEVETSTAPVSGSPAKVSSAPVETVKE